MVSQNKGFGKRVFDLEKKMNRNFNEPEFYGVKTFYSEEEAKTFEDKWNLENERKKYKKYGFPGLIIIHGEEMRPQSKGD